jgi:hypothetical protein
VKDLVLIQDVSLRKPSLNMTTLFRSNSLSFFKLSHYPYSSTLTKDGLYYTKDGLCTPKDGVSTPKDGMGTLEDGVEG